MGKQTNALLIVAAGTEALTGLLLIAAPAFIVHLLFGGELPGPGRALATLGGFALVSFALACWPSQAATGPRVSALRALLLYNLLAAVYFIYLGVSRTDVGILLWPAAVLHSILASLLGAATFRGFRYVES